TRQPLGTLAMLLLEPQSPDSLFQWGYFLEIMNRTEYFEAYAIEPLAQRMLQRDPALAKEFREKLATDSEFAADAKARLHWFYERTPFHDSQYRLYPIARSVD
ncbi:MAG: carboxypeptidase, partial [Gammaproteobacteria bacterium]|nr:carboxypeptidase [Gammaproteobacteria bacterium]